VRLVWVVIPLVLFGFIGMQESFAEERTWYVGEGLKQGDYFSYKLCHAVYNDCSEFHMDLWIEGDVQRGSETNWLTQTVVYDNNKVVKGVMHLGKVASEPTYSSHEIALYKSAFRVSITELAAFSSILHPGNLTLGDYWYKNMKFIPIGQTPINVNATENEKITVPAGTYDTVVLSYSNSQDRIWIVDDFPFPIKGEAWEPGNEPKSKRYQFELLDYKENVLEDPFVPITLLDKSFADVQNSKYYFNLPNKNPEPILFGIYDSKNCPFQPPQRPSILSLTSLLDYFFGNYAILVGKVIRLSDVEGWGPEAYEQSAFIVEKYLKNPHWWNLGSASDCKGENSLSFSKLKSLRDADGLILILQAKENGRGNYIQQFFPIDENKTLKNFFPTPKIQNKMIKEGSWKNEWGTKILCYVDLVPIQKKIYE